MVPLGQPVAQADVAKRMGLRLPEAGEALLVPAQPAEPSGLARETAAFRAGACPGCGTRQRAAAEPPDDDDLLVAAALAEWEQDMAPMIQPLLEAAQAASSYEEFEQLLAEMQPDTAALARRLAILTMKARGDGDGGR